MNKKLKDRLIELGMPEDATEEEALAFLDTLSASDRQRLEEPTAEEPKEPARPSVQEEVGKAVNMALREERERVAGIRALAARFGLTELAENFLRELSSYPCVDNWNLVYHGLLYYFDLLLLALRKHEREQASAIMDDYLRHSAEFCYQLSTPSSQEAESAPPEKRS